MRTGTLSFRLFVLTSLWALVSVAMVAIVLTEAYRRNAERRFGDLVTANLYNLMGSIEPGADGRLSGAPELGDARYRLFGSGWYWSVEALADPSNRAASESLAGARIPQPAEIPLDANFQRQFDYLDANEQSLSAVEAQVFLGAGADIFSFRITGNKGELAAEIAAYRGTLVILLSLFGLGFVAASYLIVRIGLGPISQATQRLADIRDGRAERLEGRFPSEIQPLIDETNALIETNRGVIERARTQVGNLAHSLKTPLAVLMNESAGAPKKLRAIIDEQTRLMRHQVQIYLDRARIAARVETVASRTDVIPALRRLVRVVAKLNPALKITLSQDVPDRLLFAGELQDFEEIAGNLLENAARFAAHAVCVDAGRLGGTPPKLELRIDDDGPGMSPEECEIALKRGIRLDETKPGSGLGLSIVRDIASEYKGGIVLDRSPLGGLRATVTLPAR